jgi:preprotein translocase subunit SecY
MAKVIQPNPNSIPASQSSTDDKLDQIIHYLHQMDRRDRMRTIGGTVRSVIALIPLLLFLLSVWYIYTNGTSLLQMVTEEAAKQAAKYATPSPDVMEQFRGYFAQ